MSEEISREEIAALLARGSEEMTREEAIGNLKHAIRWNDMPKKEALEMAIKALEQEPKTGHWITKIKSDLRGDMRPTNPKCSECGGEPYYGNTIYNYKSCPYCGCRMVEPQESEAKS